jgi:hypothetical protein
MLPEDIFYHTLGQTIRYFNCCDNNLIELPASFILVDPTALVSECGCSAKWACHVLAVIMRKTPSNVLMDMDMDMGE